MKTLNAQQLAFILDIKKEDARARMCNAWCKYKDIPKTDSWKVEVPGAERSRKKIQDPYPLGMAIDVLAVHLNIPTLQQMVDDIQANYLTRPASRRWILREYPEKKLLSAEADGKAYPIKIDLPPALKSLLPESTIRAIYNYWISDFKTINLEPKICVK